MSQNAHINMWLLLWQISHLKEHAGHFLPFHYLQWTRAADPIIDKYLLFIYAFCIMSRIFV